MSPRNEGSFSRKVKDELIALDIKKKCCIRAFDDAVSLRERPGDRSAIISGERMVCDKCAARFAAGLFVSFGSITDPKKAHHMEFSLSTEAERDAVGALLSTLGYPPSSGERKGRFLTYFKSADTIVDFLGTLGANNSMFDYLNARIMDSILNDTNRRVNFDNANIKKSLNATKAQIDVIELIVGNGYLNELSAELRETVRLRLEYPESTLADLGMKFHDPISKSGVCHRMGKINDFARKKKLI